MMPILQPLPTQSIATTEYEKEQEYFAKMQVDLRPRHRIVTLGLRVLTRIRGPRFVSETHSRAL